MTDKKRVSGSLKKAARGKRDEGDLYQAADRSMEGGGYAVRAKPTAKKPARARYSTSWSATDTDLKLMREIRLALMARAEENINATIVLRGALRGFADLSPEQQLEYVHRAMND